MAVDPSHAITRYPPIFSICNLIGNDFSEKTGPTIVSQFSIINFEQTLFIKKDFVILFTYQPNIALQLLIVYYVYSICIYLKRFQWITQIFLKMFLFGIT
ncbi:MAG: hypothetical protein CM15mP29_2120 [Alphaproteobacteria bacterium]|nr:MAG: hypothetical protein CM15mP29_2120 [Alphaproteobacteria bacterium]